MSFTSYSRRSFSGTAPDTTLSANISNTDLTITLTDATGWPDGTGGKFTVIFEPDTANEEKALASARTGNTITIDVRGWEGSAASHTASTTVRHGGSAKDFDEANYTVSKTVGAVTSKGDMLAADAANSLARVAKGTAGQSPVWAADGSVSAGNPTPAAHTHAESDVTNLAADLAGKQAVPASGWQLGWLLEGKADGTADTLPSGAAGTVLTAQADGSLGWQAPSTLTAGLLAHVDYTSTTGLLGTSLAALDTTNLTASFTVPSSGKVLVRAGGRTDVGNTSGTLTIGWLNHSGGAQVGRSQTTWKNGSNASETLRFAVAQTLTGLSAGTTLQLDLAASFSTGNQYHLTDLTIEVWAAA